MRYYYLPDVEAYYDVQTSTFIYYGGGAWVHRRYLPVRYRSYDLYSGYKVVMTDYHGDAPYVNFKDYKRRYARGYHKEAQKTIGERPSKGNHIQEKVKPANQNNKYENVRNQSEDNGKRLEHNDSKSHGNDKGMNGNGGHNNQSGKKK